MSGANYLWAPFGLIPKKHPQMIRLFTVAVQKCVAVAIKTIEIEISDRRRISKGKITSNMDGESPEETEFLWVSNRWGQA